jgi:hypothetical protein
VKDNVYIEDVTGYRFQVSGKYEGLQLPISFRLAL